MNANALSKHYAQLTAEERFRLIVAAGARGDEAERERLLQAGQSIRLSVHDHAPFAHAFAELDVLTFIELVEEAAAYLDALHWANDAEVLGPDDARNKSEDDAVEEAEAGSDAADGETADEEEAQTPAERYFDLALAHGYVLKTKAEGWKLFCERLNLPPFAAWKYLPGYDRLQRALKVAETVAFVPEGFLRYLNAIRPAGKPARTEVPLTVERVAAASADLFRQCVAWWGG